MRDPIPFRLFEEGLEGGAGRLLDAAQSAAPWPLERRAAVRWSVKLKTSPRDQERSRRARVKAFAVCAALSGAFAGLAAVLLARTAPSLPSLAQPAGITRAPDPIRPPPSRWNHLDLDGVGTIEIAVEEDFQITEKTNEYQLQMTRGTLRAHILPQAPARPVVVLTPHLRVVVLGTRFDVHSDGTASTVTLIEGQVRVEANSRSVVLAPGMTIRSDDERLRPGLSATLPDAPLRPDRAAGPLQPRAARPAAAPASAADCSRLQNPSATWLCLEKLASGNDLASQNALFTLAEMARDLKQRPDAAATWFRRYVNRFPQGALVPEALLGLLDASKAVGDFRAAIEAAEQFARRFPGDRRAPEVALVRLELMCRDPTTRAQAVEEIRRLLPASPDREGLERLESRCAAPPPSAAGPPRAGSLPAPPD